MNRNVERTLILFLFLFFPLKGMVLCAVSADHSVIKLLEAPANANAGDRITFPGFTGEAASSAQMAKKKILEKLASQVFIIKMTTLSGFSSSFFSAFLIAATRIFRFFYELFFFRVRDALFCCQLFDTFSQQCKRDRNPEVSLSLNPNLTLTLTLTLTQTLTPT